MARLVIKLGNNDTTTLAKIRDNVYSILANNVEVEFTQQSLDNLVSTWKRIKEDNNVKIGVIAYDKYDFRDYVENFGHLNNKTPLKPYGKYAVFDGSTLYRITEVSDLCSYSYDEVRETSSARENEEYDKIKEMLPLHLNKKR